MAQAWSIATHSALIIINDENVRRQPRNGQDMRAVIREDPARVVLYGKFNGLLTDLPEDTDIRIKGITITDSDSPSNGKVWSIRCGKKGDVVYERADD
jgi:hypothetical protein